jgi:hypothetical protein
MSNQGRELALPSQSGPERSVSVDDGSPPPAYVPRAVSPTLVAKEGPSGGTGIKSGGMSPRTSPTASIRTHQPERRDPMQLPSDLAPTPSRGYSTQTHQSGNAAPASAALSKAGHSSGGLGVSPGHFGIISLPTHFRKPDASVPHVATVQVAAVQISTVQVAAVQISNV